MELRAGDRIRWTRNNARLGLVNSRTAEVGSVGQDRVAFRLEDGRRLELGRTGPAIWTMPVRPRCMHSRDAPSTTRSP